MRKKYEICKNGERGGRENQIEKTINKIIFKAKNLKKDLFL